jgi:hypothetical protein
MSVCDDLQPSWAVVLGLPPDDAQRQTALAHAGGCARCTAEALGAQALLAALDTFTVPAPTAAALRRAAAPVLEDLARSSERSRRFAAGAAAVASLVGFALLAGLAQRRAPMGQEWGVAVAFAVVAAASTASAVLFRARALWAILPISAAMAAALSSTRSLDLGGALGCALGEGIGASLPLAALSYLLLRRPFALGPSGAAAVAAGGALAGQAALVLTCPSHGIGHLMLFHAGTVALAALLGYVWGQRPLIVASRSF